MGLPAIRCPPTAGQGPENVWSAGGGVTVTGAPKSLNVRTCVVTNTLIALVSRMARTSTRARPCWSTLTVPLSLISPPGPPLNAYRVPVHPGPEAGPATVTLSAFLISASICCGVAVVKELMLGNCPMDAVGIRAQCLPGWSTGWGTYRYV